MSFARHPDLKIQRLTIGTERAPLLVIDNVLADPDALVEIAAAKSYGDVTSYYPGVRAKAPLLLQQFLLDLMREEFAPVFGLKGALRFTSCHFSLITTPKERLTYLQRIPHIDSVFSDQLALVFYLFKESHGGTAFYRHRRTGFEVVDESRNPEYWGYVQEERAEIEREAPAFISGSTPFYEQVGHQEGVFNRMLVYRRTSLHCGAINPDFVPVNDPLRGRLTLNGFLSA
jgi:hypothetical protein